MNIIEQVKNAGIVGAGGAGFPTYIKLAAKVDTVIVNGAECEPLLKIDQKLMALYAKEIVTGLILVMNQTGAGKGVIALKKKYKDAALALEKEIKKDSRLEIFRMNSFYPAGDEQTLVYEVTGRIVPEGGIPLAVGVVVSNVTTLYNIFCAVEKNQNVTTRPLTVGGEVKTPYSAFLPVGITFREAIDLAGGPVIDDYVILCGGPMMGYITENEGEAITKTTGGIIVLPRDHFFVLKKTQKLSWTLAQGKASCEQCFRCTEVCPRYLIGHSLEPHKMMRQTQFDFNEAAKKITTAYLCCECGLCGLYACPQGLLPFRYYQEIKRILGKEGIKNPHNNKPLSAHPMKEYRKVSTHRLIARLGLSKYDIDIPFKEINYEPKEVKINLKQHLGVPAVPVVKQGDIVKQGQLLADIPEGKMGAKVHSSMDGRVVECAGKYIRIVK